MVQPPAPDGLAHPREGRPADRRGEPGEHPALPIISRARNVQPGKWKDAGPSHWPCGLESLE